MQPSDMIPSKKATTPISNFVPKKDGIKNLSHLQARYKVIKPNFRKAINWEEEQMMREMVLERNPTKNVKKIVNKNNRNIIYESNENNES